MTKRYMTLLLVLVAAAWATAAVAQEFPMQQDFSGRQESYQQAPSTSDLTPDDSMELQVQVNRTEILFTGLPAPYGIDQWATSDVDAALEDPAEMRMFVDEPNPYRDHDYRGCACFGCGSLGLPSFTCRHVLEEEPVKLERYPQLYATQSDDQSPRRSRYAGMPNTSADFIVVDFGSSTHLGLVGPAGPR